MDYFDIFLGITMGIGLSVAVGFRIFVPLFIISIASLSGHIELTDEFSWISSYPALIAFGLATLIEILAYYIPWIDNLMDTISIPVATIAGTIITASFVSELDPFLTWTLGIIAGGGSASITQLATTAVRGTSTATTGGLGNFLVSTFELISSIFISIISLIAPFIGLILITIIGVLGYKMIKKFKRKKVVSL